MRTESITCRPYFGIPTELTEYFEYLSVRFDPDEDYDDGRSVKVGIPTFDATLELQFDRSLQNILLGIDRPEDWTLTVVLADETKRESKVLSQAKVTDLDTDGVLHVPTKNLSISWSGRDGATLSIYLALNTNRKLINGMPNKYGEIAAMKHFSINRSGPGAEYQVEFWSDNEMIARGFPSGTTVAVSGVPDDLREENAEELNISFAINDRLRSAFATSRRSRKFNLIQDTVKSHALAQLVLMARDAGELSASSVGYKLLKKIGIVKNEPFVNLEHKDISVLVAHAQVYCNLTDVCKGIE